MSEISEINMPNVIHVQGVSEYPKQKQFWCLGKCPEKNAELLVHQQDVHK